MNMTATTPLASAMPGDHGDVIARLAAPRQEIEREFLQMGDKLIACTRLLNEASEAHAQMAGALAGSDFQTLADSLQRLSTFVERMDQNRIATEAFLGQLNELTAQFPDRISDLTRAVRTLRMFFVTSRTVAATTGTPENNLVQFSDQFSDLGSRLDGSMRSFDVAFARMRDNLNAVSEMNARFGARHAELLAGIATKQTQNLEAMQQCHLWAEGRISAHGERSQRINDRVSRAVSTLQVGDSTRQRVEHVEEALQGLDGGDDRSLVPVIQCLMAAQLNGTVEEFDQEIGALSTLLEELSQDTEVMLDTAAADSETLLSSGDSALGAIDGSLHQISRMFVEYERSNATLTVAIDQLVAAVGKMLNHVSEFDELRQNLRLLSLNATIRSKALNDDGRAFQQIAMELRALNDESNAPVEEMMGKLEESEVILRGFLDVRTSGEEGGTEAMQNTLDASLECVGNIADQLREQAAIMAETGPQALARLRDAAASVTGRRDFCAEWRIVAAELTAVAGEPDLQAAGADSRAGLLAKISETYSMTAERDIHNTLLGIVAEADSPPDGEEEDTSDDIFF